MDGRYGESVTEVDNLVAAVKFEMRAPRELQFPQRSTILCPSLKEEEQSNPIEWIVVYGGLVHEYEEVKMDEQVCVGTQTDPVSSDDEDHNVSEHMDEYFEGGCEVNALEYEVSECGDYRCSLLMIGGGKAEVVLKRSSSRHRLGLTLCYGATDDNDTDIFISEIEAGSTADLDGRLRAGDQILQVNGEAIHSRLDAIEQFRSNRREITILLARTPQIDRDCCNPATPFFPSPRNVDMYCADSVKEVVRRTQRPCILEQC
ncbi:unnamed protein product [Toxocara canis]|uniref:PDZ domain-containing protein n=1 Tax=Toxocara canis TaxID=6265 RepID=A0A183UF31_TOXCA|nr:unnamed protein product [Toxocara canis]